MRRINHKKNLTTSIILLLILAIGIGYAYLTSNLSITGSTEVVANTWNIHFENLSVSEGSISTTNPATIQSNTVDITYSISLSRPKDFYEFTVDVKNDGTLPGKVSISSLSGITTTAAPIIDYNITYSNGRPVNVGDKLNGGSKKTIKVRVFYKDDISENDFPANDLNLTLTYTLQYAQSDEDEINTETIVQDLITNDSTCFIKYNGQVTDTVNNTTTASKVYFDKCADKRNIIFNNMCWQVIRTTETGGIKMIYNGDVVDGKCESTRSSHTGITQNNNAAQFLNHDNTYGSTFRYDTSTGYFTLLDTFTTTWSDSTYENILGKFTCQSLSNTCTTMYQINGYQSDIQGNTSDYTINTTNYAQIGTSSYNSNTRSPAMIGYMFNKVYNYKTKTISSTTKFASTFTYTNGTYTLSGTTQNITSLSGANIANTHYTCWNDTGTCNTISYVYFINGTTGYYVEITSGKNVNDALNEMLYADDVNYYNSSIKGILDVWYRENLASKTNMLEDTIFCNSREIINSDNNGWKPNGGSTSEVIKFKNYNMNETDLSCPNLTDQFAVSNNKAKLTYPVALLQNEERTHMDNTPSLMVTGTYYWGISPFVFSYFDGNVDRVGWSGYADNVGVSNPSGIRPVISLKSGTVFSSGTGSETTPWVVD